MCGRASITPAIHSRAPSKLPDDSVQGTASAKSPMNFNRAFRRSLSVVPTFPGNGESTSRALSLNSCGQLGSQGSGHRSAKSIALHAARGRLAHHRCSVDGMAMPYGLLRAPNAWTPPQSENPLPLNVYIPQVSFSCSGAVTLSFTLSCGYYPLFFHGAPGPRPRHSTWPSL